MMALRPLFPGLVVLLLLAGCGGGGPKLVPVSGQVTFLGQPVAGASVTLHPVGEGSVAGAITDAGGKFVLVTNKREGAIPGRYKVAVSKHEVLNLDPDKPGDFTGVRIAHVIPERYSHVDTSELTANIEGAKDDLNFALTE